MRVQYAADVGQGEGVQALVLAVGYAGPVVAAVFGEDGPTFAVAPLLLYPPELGGDAANFLLQGWQFRVHAGLVEVPDAGHLAPDEFDVLCAQGHMVPPY